LTGSAETALFGKINKVKKANEIAFIIRARLHRKRWFDIAAFAIKKVEPQAMECIGWIAPKIAE
jgi:hypothetical protein